MAALRCRGQTKHILSELLSWDEKSVLEEWLGPETLVTASGICQLLVDFGTRQWTLLSVGIVCLTKDKRRRIYCIQFFDCNGQLLMEQRIYRNFITYSCPMVEKLLQFEGDHCVYGLNFTDVNEARFFKNTLRDLEHRRDQQSTNVQSSPAPISDLVYKPVSANNTLKKTKKKKKKITRLDIGLPSQFRHISHFDISPQKSFVREGAKAEPKLDPRICSLLETIGEPIDQLTNDDEEFIRDFIEKQGGVGNVERELTKGAPAYTNQPFSQIVPNPTLNRPNQSTRPKMSCPPPPPPPPPPPMRIPCQPTIPPPPPPMPSSFGSIPNMDQGRSLANPCLAIYCRRFCKGNS